MVDRIRKLQIMKGLLPLQKQLDISFAMESKGRIPHPDLTTSIERVIERTSSRKIALRENRACWDFPFRTPHAPWAN